MPVVRAALRSVNNRIYELLLFHSARTSTIQLDTYEIKEKIPVAFEVRLILHADRETDQIHPPS